MHRQVGVREQGGHRCAVSTASTKAQLPTPFTALAWLKPACAHVACLPGLRAAGQWRAFSGNEIGAMLAEWVLRNHRHRQQQQEQQGGQQEKEKLAVLSSTVSSRMLAAIAEQEGIHWAETLTGAPC